MGGKELGLSLLCFSSLYIFASSSSVQVNKSSEFLQKINLGDKVIYGEDRVIYGNKIEGSFGHGSANGGGSTGSGENGNNGGTRSPNTQGETSNVMDGKPKRILDILVGSNCRHS
ncbi:hypothetical protein O6P43_004884 [Quillaja saponaria]|uniref:Uncharacterized protein n=1 Tax=Quillaja saponaria TaxID=32244 RepID=A0AAD7Q4R9_QUISA|nr:hypothetical protein O6P43_004884 [Quillaja saponaria]